MHPSIKNALEEIDAAMFSGDEFNSLENSNTLMSYIQRWQRGLVQCAEGRGYSGACEEYGVDE